LLWAHKNLYASADPVNNVDPSGHGDFDLAVVFTDFAVSETLDTMAHPLLPPPTAELKTEMQGHTTTFYSTDRIGHLITTQIETRNDVAKKAKPGAADPYSTRNIVGVSNRHAGEAAYGPAGAFIDTADPRSRVIHGGGTGLPDPMAPQQGWKPTLGCTRGQN